MKQHQLPSIVVPDDGLDVRTNKEIPAWFSFVMPIFRLVLSLQRSLFRVLLPHEVHGFPVLILSQYPASLQYR